MKFFGLILFILSVQVKAGVLMHCKSDTNSFTHDIIRTNNGSIYWESMVNGYEYAILVATGKTYYSQKENTLLKEYVGNTQIFRLTEYYNEELTYGFQSGVDGRTLPMEKYTFHCRPKN